MVIRRIRKEVSRLLSSISPGYSISQKHMSVLPSKSLRYFVAVAVTAVAFTARFLLESALGEVAPLLIFTLSVTVAAWYGGLRPGLLATALSALLGAYFFIEPLYSFRINTAERIEVVVFLGIGISISVLSQARLSAQAKLQQLLASEQDARSSAEEANRFKDEFLATVSHELKTPLTAINGWARMLRRGRLNTTESSRALDIIERSAKSQNQLIDDLLDVSRIITGNMRLNVCPIALGSVVEAAVEVVRPAVEAKGIYLSVTLDPSAEPVSGDAERLQQVVWNLLSNAVKFAPNGGQVKVKLRRVNRYVEITVSDNGHGINPEFLPYVFDRFRQEEGGMNRQKGGLGLGLAIVRHIVELHGGTVQAMSEGLGKGATFTVTLPVSAVRTVSLDELSDHSAGRRPEPQNSPSLAGVRALLVEDETDARELVTLMLMEGGMEVRTAVSAAEALDACDEWRPDILIADIGMPVEDGYTLMKKLRARENERGGHLPAIALTAYARQEDRLRAFSAGYESHVPKPVEPVELLAVVASLTNRTGNN